VPIQLSDIPLLTKSAPYRVDIEWGRIEEYLAGLLEKEYRVDLDPDFQRGHVWDDEKRTRYIEYVLRGGKYARDIFFNCPLFGRADGAEDPSYMPLVDGKQRLSAVRMFLRDEVGVFGGHVLSDFADRDVLLRRTDYALKININDLPTRAGVLQWYLDLNDGGVVHRPEELARVRDMLTEALDMSAGPVI
jgi:hypothetical protein